MVVLRFNGDMPKDPEILQIEISNFLAQHNVIIREGSIEAIQEAVKNNLDVAEIAAIQYQETDQEFVLSLPREKWGEYLSSTLDSLAEQDEFELCIKIRNLLIELV
jgi:hypothetical protein